MKKIHNDLKELFSEHQDIAIFSHMRPDGDSIGSSLAMDIVLKKEGKNSKIFFRDPIPEVYRFLPFKNSVFPLDDFEPTDFDIIIVLDISEISRIGIQEDMFEGKTIVCIDHHSTNSGFARYNLINHEKAATALLLFEFLMEAYPEHIDKNVADCLLTGLITDTGGFKYRNTTHDVFSAVSELLKHGVDYQQLMTDLYSSYPTRKFRLLKRAMRNSSFEDDIVYSYLTVEDFEETGCLQEDTDGIVNQLMIYKNIDIAFLMMETSKVQQKISIRSKNSKVSEVAVSFGGGGHINAAGFNTHGKTEDNIKKILKVIREQRSNESERG